MKKKDIMIGLHESTGIGWKTMSRILSSEEWPHALEFDIEDWKRHGLNARLAERMEKEFTAEWIEQRLARMTANHITPLTPLDQEYSILMKETVRPPWVIYAKGRTELLNSPRSIAMVGTRIPTAYGRKVGQMLAESLGNSGVTIVSGMAKGIDGICHESAVRSPGSTIAVLGTAIDKPYPPEHTSLYHQIAEYGLVISEYPIGTPPHPGLFPQRNRIIAGITKGTIVVEADERSGSLITADAALEANRDVFSVPGPITSPKSKGTLNLIKQGAKLVTGPEDVLDEYGWARAGSNELANMQNGKKLTENEDRIYHMLEQGNRAFDELLALTGWEFGLLHSVLLSLIIKKQAVQLAGSIYKLV
ncbi:DNA-protecting protein DprA [Paenibacillus sp. CAA11]|uniref:DNA-processing protein DprA n=1 Tax=Paenibacillus sp. CAA11 TaxID=1532905 RepID=UPI000D3AC52E|nr:DNA-processing protein DprA [Paenibacillus sp. CAA11]AWB44284.1 DNA-protecting protein DprA [Paenibacillus sp. CAA11]